MRKSVEENSTPCQKVDSNRDLCRKVEKKAEKPVNKSLIDYPKNIENHSNGVSPARKALFDVINGKTVIEHLKENGITYSNFDNRIRKNWSVAEACTTPLASWGKGKRKRVVEVPEESEEPKEIYRAFTLDEFVNSYSLGDKIILRRKKGNRDIRHTLFTEYIEGDTDVCFNGIWYALDRLFNEYELYTGKGWKPFGIEVKE